MADVTIDIELTPGLGLPYAEGAEASLPPGEAAAFAAVSGVAGVPLTLMPGFALPVDTIADVLAAARQGGVEPPDLFAWFAVSCPDSVASTVAAALAALPFVVHVELRPEPAVARWQATTDPEAMWERYLRRPLDGMDVFAAWQVPGGDGRGVRVADVEESWDLTHPDLQPANVTVLLPSLTTKEMQHGTGCLGIVGARTTGVGLTGIAPGASLAVAAHRDDSAAAIVRAAQHVGRGGVVLLEICVRLTNAKTADAPLELSFRDRAAVQAAVALGVLVVEPAGNGKVNLDTDPRVAFIRAFPPGMDSGALVVAAGERQLDADGNATGAWMASDFTSGGSRVDCFAAGSGIAAPQSPPTVGGFTTGFGGTSGASAIIAGVAATLQGVATASGAKLSANALRERLKDPAYGRPAEGVSPVNPQAIGIMPDLERLIDGLGVPRLPPAAAIPTADGLVLMRSRRGDVDQIEILEWHEATQQFTWSLTRGENPDAITSGHLLALHARPLQTALAIDAVCPTQIGLVAHRRFVLDAGLGLADPWRRVTEPTDYGETFALASPLSAVGAAGRLFVSGLSVEGQPTIVVFERKPDGLHVFPVTSPGDPHQPVFVSITTTARFESPPILYDADGTIALVAVDSGGDVWFSQFLTVGSSAVAGIGTRFDPAEPPALAHLGSELYVLGLDPTSHELREIAGTRNAAGVYQWAAPRTITQPLATWGVSIELAGAIAATTDKMSAVMVIGLTAGGLPVSAVRLAGFDWSPLLFVPTLTTFVPRAGVALASPAAGVFMAFASDERGALYSARWTVAGWTPFAAV